MPHRILVVDDEEGVRSLIHDALVRRGFEVHTAAHGEDGIQLFGHVAPHLVILDFLVPKKNGFGVAEAIRATPMGADTPIVMLSGVFKNPKTAVEARDKYGVVEFLSKPIDVEQLERLVARSLEGVAADPATPGESEAPTPPPELRGPAPAAARSTPPALRREDPAGAPRAAPSVEAVAAVPPSEAETPEPTEPIVDGVFVGRPLPRLEEEGDLGVHPVAELLATILYDRATGMLDLTANGIHRRIYAMEGRPTFMQSNAERENVGILLLRRGRLTEHDVQRCRRYMQERRRTLQQSLLELKLVNEAELATAYRILAAQLLPEGVGMAAGRFRWRATDAFVGRVPEGRFEPLQVIFKGILDHAAPPRIFAYFSGREHVPIYRTRLWSERLEAFRRVFPAASELVDRIDGSQTFRSLSRARDLDAGMVLPALFALVTSGMAVLPVDEGGVLGLEAAVHAAAAEMDDDEDDPELGASVSSDGPVSPDDARARARVERFHEDLMSRDFFQVFGVDEDADTDAVKSAYFELAKRWHVDAFAGRDLGPSKAKLEEIFARISEAYDTITDRERREEYRVFLDRKRRGLPTDVSEILRGEQLFDQAAAMMRRKDWAGAREVLEEAVKLSPDPLYHATLGWAVYNQAPDDQGALTAAVGNLKRALKEQENLPIAYQYLGTIAFHRGRHTEAKRWWQRCLEWEPTNVEASRGLRMIAQRADDRRGKSLLERFRGKK